MEAADKSSGEGVHQNTGPHEEELLRWLEKVAVQPRLNLPADATIIGEEDGKKGLGRGSVSATGVDPAAREAGFFLKKFDPPLASLPKERLTRTYGRSPSVLAMVVNELGKEEAEARKRMKKEEEKALHAAVQALDSLEHRQEEEELQARQRHANMIQSIQAEIEHTNSKVDSLRRTPYTSPRGRGQAHSPRSRDEPVHSMRSDEGSAQSRSHENSWLSEVDVRKAQIRESLHSGDISPEMLSVLYMKTVADIRKIAELFKMEGVALDPETTPLMVMENFNRDTHVVEDYKELGETATVEARDCLAAHDLESAKFYILVAKTAYCASDLIGRALMELVENFNERFPDHPICDDFDVLPPWTGHLQQTWDSTFIKMKVTMHLAEKVLEKAQRALHTPEEGSSEGEGFSSTKGSLPSVVTAEDTRTLKEILHDAKAMLEMGRKKNPERDALFKQMMLDPNVANTCKDRNDHKDYNEHSPLSPMSPEESFSMMRERGISRAASDGVARTATNGSHVRTASNGSQAKFSRTASDGSQPASLRGSSKRVVKGGSIKSKAGAVVAALSVMPKRTKQRVKKEERKEKGEDAAAGHGEYEKGAGGTQGPQNSKNPGSDDHEDHDDNDNCEGGGDETLPTVSRGCGNTMFEELRQMHRGFVSVDGAAVIIDNSPPKHPYRKTVRGGGNGSYYGNPQNQEEDRESFMQRTGALRVYGDSIKVSDRRPGSISPPPRNKDKPSATDNMPWKADNSFCRTRFDGYDPATPPLTVTISEEGGFRRTCSEGCNPAKGIRAKAFAKSPTVESEGGEGAFSIIKRTKSVGEGAGKKKIASKTVEVGEFGELGLELARLWGCASSSPKAGARRGAADVVPKREKAVGNLSPGQALDPLPLRRPKSAELLPARSSPLGGAGGRKGCLRALDQVVSASWDSGFGGKLEPLVFERSKSVDQLPEKPARKGYMVLPRWQDVAKDARYIMGDLCKLQITGEGGVSVYNFEAHAGCSRPETLDRLEDFRRRTVSAEI